ncbi:exodeoxyribonuclease VII large subunit [Crassaminicella profunda]|uniref:exodeoxyribonuclease VII large subunit n=1 Tax=Crassaminicella profunda TaxID=1286698 RepID=UPI001CA794CF|nr:exodeoxyribonuclease VII large subunit [Crassaminicella profunda]QZY56956.1 exodeoxyribonuclease VII large subunit [Crassaminicella profunda]
MRIRSLTVSELNKYIKKILSSDPILNHIHLKGEISNFKAHGSGHFYFSLKDEKSKINCVMFKGNNQRIKFIPENGMKVLVKGYVSAYERDGQYQLYIEEMEPDGIGALYLAFEQLKIKLEKSGLFDSAKKQKIPFFPKKIAVVTSPTGAAIRDIISVIKRRNHYVDIVIYPVLVQGENAAGEISKAIDQINQNATSTDLIIIGRGGGSIEELWAFNEEVVAQSIFHSKIPIISAVGHETDYTISDFVADLRAPTPSSAAELAVPRILDIKYALQTYYNKMNASLSQGLKEKRNALVKVDETKLLSYLQNRINEERQTLDLVQKDLSNHAHMKLESYKARLVGSIAKLEAINPLSTILRGYAIVFDKDHNQIINTIEKVSQGDSINIMLTDGVASCIVTEKEKEEHLFEYISKFKTQK